MDEPAGTAQATDAARAARLRDALRAVDGWPVGAASAAVVLVDRPDLAPVVVGDAGRVFALASVTKLVTALAVLVACEEGTLALDGPAGPPGATLADLLAHSSGLGPDPGVALAPARTRRIYTNAGYDLAGRLLADASGLDARTYVAEAVFGPLGMATARLAGSPASDGEASVADLVAFVRELCHPRLLSAPMHARMVAPHLPDLAGVVPGFGRHDPCPWGLGPELRGHKTPHWTAPDGSPGTFGHFGRSGTMLWVDPVARVALVALTDRDFGPWAAAAWPALSTAVLAAVR